MLNKFIVLAVVLGGTAATAFGTVGTLSVSPAVVMLQGSPGQSTAQTLTIVNTSKQTLTFEMQAKDVITREGRRVFVDAGKLTGSIATTAVFSRRSVTVAPGEQTTVTVTVTIPPNPVSRAVIALFHGTTRIRTAGVQATASLGTLMTFALSSNTTATASPLIVKEPTATTNLLLSQRLSNSGSEPVLAKGMMAILNPAGVLVARQELPARRLLPGEQFDVSTDYGGELASGHYRALLTYDLQNNHSVTSAAEFNVK
jgi:hypothetical protein